MSELLAREGVGTIIAIATAARVAVLLGAVGLIVVERLSLSGKLRQLADLYKLVDSRDQETLLPSVDRVAAPGHRGPPPGDRKRDGWGKRWSCSFKLSGRRIHK